MGMMTGLSNRETTIAERYGAGETYRDIAGDLGIAPTTVRNHVAAIYRKLGVRNKVQLVNAMAAQSSTFGALPPPGPSPRSRQCMDILNGGTANDFAGPSIAIMPFDYFGPDDRDYIAYGLSADIQHALTRCHDLFVSGRSSSLVQSAVDADPLVAAKAIGVDYILRGTVRSDGDRIIVTVELVDGQTGTVRWSERFDGQVTDVLSIEDETVQAIAADLSLEINDHQYRKRRRLGDDELTAYDWRLRGNRLLELGGRSNIEGARTCFERSLAAEPDSAATLAGLSMCYGYECDLLLTGDFAQCLEKHSELAELALAADEADSRGHYAISCALMFRGKYAEADRHAARGLELNPSEYHNICNRGYSLMALGKTDESLFWFAQSLRRNLLAPNSCLLAIGTMEYLEEDYGQSAAALSQLTAYRVQRASTIAAACAQVGFVATARNAVQEFEQLSRDIPTRPSGSSSADWRLFWSRVYPYLRGDPLEHMLDGIKKAALPV